MLKTLILALLAGIALSPAASAATERNGEPVAKAPVVTSSATVQQSAAATCSAAAFSVTLAVEASETAFGPLPVGRCYALVQIFNSSGQVVKWAFYAVTCP